MYLLHSNIIVHFQFTPSYGQQHDNANALAQYQHPPQMLAPPGGQPWPSSASQSVAPSTSVQPAGLQSSGATLTDAVSVLLILMRSTIFVFIIQ